jgi:hypothetical protein
MWRTSDTESECHLRLPTAVTMLREKTIRAVQGTSLIMHILHAHSQTPMLPQYNLETPLLVVNNPMSSKNLLLEVLRILIP